MTEIKLVKLYGRQSGLEGGQMPGARVFDNRETYLLH